MGDGRGLNVDGSGENLNEITLGQEYAAGKLKIIIKDNIDFLTHTKKNPSQLVPSIFHKTAANNSYFF